MRETFAKVAVASVYGAGLCASVVMGREMGTIWGFEVHDLGEVL